MSKTRLKHIVISEENYSNLKKLGNAGESFNDVITSLMQKMQEIHDED